MPIDHAVSRSLATLAFLTALLGLGAPAALAAPAAEGWLAYGDLRGYLEPCGCDPATDLGGVKRLATVIERERVVRPALGVFDLGNNLASAGESDLKTPFLLEAAAVVRPTAVLLNVAELGRLPSVSAWQLAAKARALPFVLTNARPRSAASAVATPSVASGEFLVLGYVSPTPALADLLPVDDARLETWKALLAKAAPGKQKVLLFSGTTADLAKIVRAKLFDVVVSSNDAPPFTDPGSAEKKTEESLRRALPPPAAQTILMVPLGGQGILRGGVMRFEGARSIAELLGGQRDCVGGGEALPGTFGSCKSKVGSPIGGGGSVTDPFRKGTLVTWLGPETGEADSMRGVYEGYQEAARQAFRAGQASRAQDLASSPFAGAEACKTCHAQPYKVFAGTKHAHAIDVLKAKTKHEDAECVACHVVGATAKGGFVSLEASPHLANVQCENCHGPSRAHAENPTAHPQKRGQAMQACATCHNGQHSPKFDRASYWQLIAH
jgi:hypothetical protein